MRKQSTGINKASRDGMRILFAASEVYPLVKTGGLADVACYLPIALHELGHDIRIIIPAYRSVLNQVKHFKPGALRQVADESVRLRLLRGKLPGSNVPLYLLDIPELYDRTGDPYRDPAGLDWPDNARRFAAFSRIIRLLALGQGGLRWRPDLIHCNDWHTGLAPALLARDPLHPATVFSIHNLAYQGDYAYDVFRSLNLPDTFWSPESMEFYGRFAFIKGGLVYADRLITVSPEYAREILTAEYGYGLEGLLAHRRQVLSGILNGVDYRFWDPRHDPFIEQAYSVSSLEGKKINKRRLQQALGLQVNDNAVLLAHISRLTWQKGIDLILDGVKDLLQEGDVQMIVLGSGDVHFEQALQTAANSFPDRMAVSFAYNEGLAHEIQAGADILLMPSRFEPCGLTQMYSLRYGTIPVVRRTGGLADTIVDATTETMAAHTATGFQFTEASVTAYLQAAHRAIACYRSSGRWRQLMQTAMQQEFNWRDSAMKYESLYYGLLAEQSSPGTNR